MLVDLFKAFDSIHRRNMDQILIAYAYSKKTVKVLMMPYKTAKTMVRSPDRDTAQLNIVARILRRGKFVPFLFIICLDNLRETSIDILKENILTLKRKRKKQASHINHYEYSLRGCSWNSWKYTVLNSKLSWNRLLEIFVFSQEKPSPCVLIKIVSYFHWIVGLWH